MILSFPLYGRKTLMPICKGDELHMCLISHLMDNGITYDNVHTVADCLMSLIHADTPSNHPTIRQSSLYEYHNL